MKFEKKTLEHSRTEFSVFLTENDVMKEFNSVYNELSFKYDIPGFRKGKVPKSILKNKLGDNYQFQVLQKLLIQSLNSILKQENIQMIGDPEFLDMDQLSHKLKEGEEFSFRFVIEESPSILEFPDLKNIKLEFSPEVYELKKLDSKIEALQREYSKLEVKQDQIVEKDTVVRIQYFFYDDQKSLEEKKEKADFELYNVDMSSKDDFFEPLKKDLLGLKLGQELDTEFLPNNQKEKLKVFLKVGEVYQSKLPALDDEFAKDLYFEDFENLKSYFETQLKIIVEENNKNNLWELIIENILEKSVFSIGEKIVDLQVKEHMNNLNDQILKMKLSFEDYLSSMNITYQDYLKKLNKDYRKGVKLHLVYEELKKQGDFKVTESDVHNELQKLIKKQDKPNLTFEDFKSRFFSDDYSIRNLKEKIEREKILSYLEKQVSFI